MASTPFTRALREQMDWLVRFFMWCLLHRAGAFEEFLTAHQYRVEGTDGRIRRNIREAFAQTAAATAILDAHDTRVAPARVAELRQELANAETENLRLQSQIDKTTNCMESWRAEARKHCRKMRAAQRKEEAKNQEPEEEEPEESDNDEGTPEHDPEDEGGSDTEDEAGGVGATV